MHDVRIIQAQPGPAETSRIRIECISRKTILGLVTVLEGKPQGAYLASAYHAMAGPQGYMWFSDEDAAVAYVSCFRHAIARP